MVASNSVSWVSFFIVWWFYADHIHFFSDPKWSMKYIISRKDTLNAAFMETLVGYDSNVQSKTDTWGKGLCQPTNNNATSHSYINTRCLDNKHTWVPEPLPSVPKHWLKSLFLWRGGASNGLTRQSKLSRLRLVDSSFSDGRELWKWM